MFDSLRRHLFEKEQSLWDGPNIEGLAEALLSDAVSMISAPFQLTRGGPDIPLLPPPPPKPKPPTVEELTQSYHASLRDVDLLPVSDEEKQELRAQLELAFLRKVEQRWNC